MKVTRLQLAEMAGKTKQAVKYSIDTGKFIEDEFGFIETEQPGVNKFIESKKNKKRKAEVDSDVFSNKKREQEIISMQLKNGEKAGDLVTRDVIDSAFIEPMAEFLSRLAGEMVNATSAEYSERIASAIGQMVSVFIIPSRIGISENAHNWITERIASLKESVSSVGCEVGASTITKDSLMAKLAARISNPNISDRDFNAHVKLLAEMSGYLKKRADIVNNSEDTTDDADLGREMTAEEAKVEYMRMIGR